MTQHHTVAACFGMALLLTACGGDPVIDDRPLQPPLNETAFIDPDILTLQDPTALDSVVVLGAGSRDMYDARTGQVGTYDVWLFRVEFDDALSLELRVNAEFDSIDASSYADLYAFRVGLLPNVLRQGLASISIHDGGENFLAVDTDLVVHVDQGEEYRIRGFLEEVLAHEAVHISLDADHASSPGWLAARQSDQRFISPLAQDFPAAEDLAETFGAWLAARWAGDGITEFLRALIVNAVPARLDYLDAQDFNMYPVVE